MTELILRKVSSALEESELVQAVAGLRRDSGQALALGDAPLRPLYRDEIARLEEQGNASPDWSRLRVADGFDWRKVRHCSFHGDVVLGRFTHSVRLAAGLELPAGLSHATVAHCVLGDNVLVRDVKLLAHYVVGEGAVLLDCGSVTCEGPMAFGNGALLPVGIESGGREVAIYAEIDVEVAAAVAGSRARREFLRAYAAAVAEYTARVTSSRGVIGRQAVLRSTATVRNAYVGPHARIDGASGVSDSTLLSSADEPVRVESGAWVTGSVLQWGSQATTLAVVERAVLLEHAHAAGHGQVTASILGPNSGVARGEVTACLLGPFVNLHHQALLIATVWPEGRGNVSAGAQVGANHTGKAPDQEFRPGEGLFLGLGAKVKFPADFRRSPYSILACGVTALPQQVRFPFALLNVPAAGYPGISPAYNEIIPAWVLTDNLYALKRNEGKYRARNQARRQRFDFRVFRPEVVDLMRDACRRLEAVRHVKEVYTDRAIEGLGKNFLLEVNRQRAIEAYRFFTRYYALLGLKEEVEAVLREGGYGALRTLLAAAGDRPGWEYARRILVEEAGVADVVAGLRQLPAILEKVAREVERSKAKDDERGVRILDDYAEAHVAAADDPFVRQTWEETRRLQREVEDLIDGLEGYPSARNGTPRLGEAGPLAAHGVNP